MRHETAELKQRAIDVLGEQRVAELLETGIVAINREYGRAYRAFRKTESDALSLLQLYFVSGGR